MDEQGDLGEPWAIIDRARGEFLSAAIQAEAAIEVVLIEFFGIDAERRDLFIETMLSGTFAAKVRALRAVLGWLGKTDEHRELLRRIDKVRDTRNRYAHDQVNPAVDDGNGMKVSWIKGATLRTTTPETMQADIHEAGKVAAEIWAYLVPLVRSVRH